MNVDFGRSSGFFKIWEFAKDSREEGWANMDMEFSKEKRESEGLINKSGLNVNAGKVLRLWNE